MMVREPGASLAPILAPLLEIGRDKTHDVIDDATGSFSQLGVEGRITHRDGFRLPQRMGVHLAQHGGRAADVVVGAPGELGQQVLQQNLVGKQPPEQERVGVGHPALHGPSIIRCSMLGRRDATEQTMPRHTAPHNSEAGAPAE